LLLQQRRLGRIGWKASIITLGGCGLGELSQEKADEAVKIALRYGVNTVDVAPSYGRAELRLAPWMKKYRKRLFVAEKTMERSKERAWAELRRSLKRLEVNSFDLYQLHAVGDTRELETVLGKYGAIRAVEEAKETGLVNHIGITGHKDMRVLKKAIKKFDFDSVLLPVNLASMSNLKPENDFRPILREAAERGMSVIAIKAIAKGRWKPGKKKYRTWYEPIDTESRVLQAVCFTLSQQPVATYSLPCDTRLWSLVLNAALKFKELDQNEQKKAIEYAREAGFRPLFPARGGEFSQE
jgi:aryl-alcohol dehydrogenase-like predicted oxidoreductase